MLDQGFPQLGEVAARLHLRDHPSDLRHEIAMPFMQMVVDADALEWWRERTDPGLEIEFLHRSQPAEEVGDHHVEAVGIEHLDHVVEACGRRDPGHAARAGFRRADAAYDADAVVPD